MMSFASRCLPVLVFSLLLSACQTAPVPYQAPVDESIATMRLLDQDLAAGRLDQAEERLNTLQQRNSSDTRLESYQRQLADAYMAQGTAALQGGNLDKATQSLAKARSLMPHAPALTSGLDDAIANARRRQIDRAERQRQQASAEEAERQEQLRQQQLLAARQAAGLQAEQAAAARTPVARQPQRAQLIDPRAASSVINLPMLDSQDNDALRNLMDYVARDVVAYNCSVRIEVRQAKDFPWVAALLSARVKRLDPGFSPSMIQSLKPDQPPRLVLTPAR